MSDSIPSQEPANFQVESLAWDKQDGLLPAVVQDAATHRVLMLGYMNREALAATQSSGNVTFYSRSKQRLWTKGESSGHVLDLVSIAADCDNDTLLVQANPRGPTCHLGTVSCFAGAPGDFMAELDALIVQRQRERTHSGYTGKLLDAGVRSMAQKVGEEGVEVALAAVVQDDAALLGEAADLLYHLAVLLRARDLGFAQAIDVLRQRRKPTSSD